MTGMETRYGVYAKDDAHVMHMVMNDLSPAPSYEAGMSLSRDEAVDVADRWHRLTGGHAYIAKYDEEGK